MIKSILSLIRRSSEGESDLTEDILKKKIDPDKLPVHVAVIMDGNGRWALNRGMPRAYGHRAGVESLRGMVQISSDMGIKVLTVYAFSTENWKRPKEEINILMDLLVEYLNKEIDELKEKNVKVRAIGKIQELPINARKAVSIAHEKTQDCTGLSLNIALNYGGRAELIDAFKGVCSKVMQGELSMSDINQEIISQHLYTSGQPDPDLLIRPSGDYRISNFLLWQLAYTEFWHTDVMWPDFKKSHFLMALLDYQRRKRRFGGLK